MSRRCASLRLNCLPVSRSDRSYVLDQRGRKSCAQRRVALAAAAEQELPAAAEAAVGCPSTSITESEDAVSGGKEIRTALLPLTRRGVVADGGRATGIPILRLFIKDCRLQSKQATDPANHASNECSLVFVRSFLSPDRCLSLSLHRIPRSSLLHLPVVSDASKNFHPHLLHHACRSSPSLLVIHSLISISLRLPILRSPALHTAFVSLLPHLFSRGIMCVSVFEISGPRVLAAIFNSSVKRDRNSIASE